MVSIPHFEDMKPREIREALDYTWKLSEKLDGTYLEVGLDARGVMYVKRKNAPACYDIADWPNEGWTATYRLAHTACGFLVESLIKARSLHANQSFGVEIIDGSMPNTIPYALSSAIQGNVVITSVNFTPDRLFHEITNTFTCHWSQEVPGTTTGWDRVQISCEQRWGFRNLLPREDVFLATRCRRYQDHLAMVLDEWFSSPSEVPGFSKLDVLETPLNRKPSEYQGYLSWPELRADLTRERVALREYFQRVLLLSKDILIRILVHEPHSAIGPGSAKEGIVVDFNGRQFKLVDRPYFSGANHFTHRVRYWLIGGRRPSRPSFLSRTAHWPKERRLARLEVLLARYQRHRRRLAYSLESPSHSQVILLTYTGDLHKRTLNLFRDTMERISDGR